MQGDSHPSRSKQKALSLVPDEAVAMGCSVVALWLDVGADALVLWLMLYSVPVWLAPGSECEGVKV
ncbi:hypothetical protein SARC_17788, partial [Sphaeroforma arctica JP610]